MSLLRCQQVWVAVAGLAFEMSLSVAGEACSLAEAEPASWSPPPNGSLPVNAPLLLAGVVASANPTVVSAQGERVEVVGEPSFGSLRFGARYGFFQPSSPLEPDAEYVLESSDGLRVPFTTRATVPRISAVLSLKTELMTIEPEILDSGSCYEAPLVGREVTRYALISATTEPWAPLILSVSTHDDESSSDVEQTLASHAVGTPPTLKLELPLPSGLDTCLHVTVLDYVGTRLLDVPRLCVTEEGSALNESVEVFDQPKASPEREAEPPLASGGCALGGAAHGGVGNWALVLALGALNRRRRPRGFVKPPTI